MRNYRITWRHEVTIAADDLGSAMDMFETMDLGHLDSYKKDKCDNEPGPCYHEYVETISAEEVDEE